MTTLGDGSGCRSELMNAKQQLQCLTGCWQRETAVIRRGAAAGMDRPLRIQ